MKKIIGVIASVAKQSRDCFVAVLLAMTFFNVSCALAADEGSFSAANAKYQAGDYKAAAALYEKIKPSTASVQYNLGNAWLRQGQKGRALLAYRRAQAMTPRDADLQWNIHLLKASLPDRMDGEAADLWGAAKKLWLEVVTLNETA